MGRFSRHELGLMVVTVASLGIGVPMSVLALVYMDIGFAMFGVLFNLMAVVNLFTLLRMLNAGSSPG